MYQLIGFRNKKDFGQPNKNNGLSAYDQVVFLFEKENISNSRLVSSSSSK